MKTHKWEDLKDSSRFAHSDMLRSIRNKGEVEHWRKGYGWCYLYA